MRVHSINGLHHIFLDSNFHRAMPLASRIAGARASRVSPHYRNREELKPPFPRDGTARETFDICYVN